MATKRRENGTEPAKPRTTKARGAAPAKPAKARPLRTPEPRARTRELPPRKRCPWAGTDPLYARYHDEEWGVPVHDDVRLFEMLTLEGAQAGLSWITILKKREGYRRAFHRFDSKRVARMTARDRARLMNDAGIVRNRAKIAATVDNAKAFLEVQSEHGSFDAYLWSFVGGAPVRVRRRTMKDVPASTPLAVAISKDLVRRGFRFVGPTIVYAFLQAVGVVDDHVAGCFRAG